MRSLITIFSSAIVTLAICSLIIAETGRGASRTRPSGVLRTSIGLLMQDSSTAHQLLAIQFPGYEDLLDLSDRDMIEESEFFASTALLKDGRKVRVWIPFELPFRLMQQRAPKVLIFGSSRSREGVRPDELSRLLGDKPVINLSVSAAVGRTIEQVAITAKRQLDRKVAVAVVFVDDFAFSDKSADNADIWRHKSDQMELGKTFFGALSTRGRSLIERVPAIRTAMPATRPLPDLAPCKANDLAAELAKPHRVDLHFSDTQLAAFTRAISIISQFAERVILIAPPVTSVWTKGTANFRFLGAVERHTGQNVIRHQLPWWGLTDADFSSRGRNGECHFDTHHVNSQAAFTMTNKLASLVPQTP